MAALAKLVLRRLAGGLLLILAVVVFDFLLVHLAPGGPAETLAGQMGGATPEVLAQIRHAYGLDRPLPVQLLTYIGHVAHGDFGMSFYFNQPVLSLVLQRLPATLLLIICAQFFAFLMGTLVGAWAARHPFGVLSRGVDVVALLGYATPVFWLGIMLLIAFAYEVPLFPISGMQTIGLSGGWWDHASDVAQHLVLPAFTLGVIYLAVYARLAKTNMLETLRADYIRLGRAKGVSEARITYRHALRNALVPVVTISGLNFSQILAGAILVETVFDWPGMGQLTYDSILRRDYPLLLGILVMSAVVVLVANIMTDIICALIDPRLRQEAGA